MTDPWLLLDCSYLVYRAQHSLYSPDATTIDGFCGTLLFLRERFDSDRFVFCFDSPVKLHRHTVLPSYKGTRRESNDDARIMAKKCMNDLHDRVLSNNGFTNCIRQPGFEADDIIASIVKHLPSDQFAVIVSSDSDLFQLIEGRRVICYNPGKNKLIDEIVLSNEYYSMAPDEWLEVKVLAGCSSDEIKGIEGVGEKTAAAYIADILPAHYKAYQAIESVEVDLLERNRKLVSLPYPGTPQFELEQPGDVDWRRLLSSGLA